MTEIIQTKMMTYFNVKTMQFTEFDLSNTDWCGNLWDMNQYSNTEYVQQITQNRQGEIKVEQK